MVEKRRDEESVTAAEGLQAPMKPVSADPDGLDESFTRTVSERLAQKAQAVEVDIDQI